MFSVPLSVRLPCPGVSRRTTLWSSDFPPTFARFRALRWAIVWLTATFPLSNPNAQIPRRVCYKVGISSWNLELGFWDFGFRLPVNLLLDAVLFELLVEIAPGRIERLRGL